MKLVALHTDFRIYWPARLNHLSKSLQKRGDELFVIEIAGKGSPYAFAESSNTSDMYWTCLFPEEELENISPAVAKKRVLLELDKIKPDAVLAGAFAFPSGAAAIDWSKKNNKSVIIFDDAKKENVPRSFIVNLIKRVFYYNIDAILCPSPDWNNTFNYWGFKNEAIFYGMDIVDNAFWKETQEEQLTIELPKRFFLCIGRQIPCKNFQMVIQAYQNVAHYTDYHLVFIGNGEDRSSLESLVNDAFRSRIHFFSFQNQKTLRQIYHKASFFILSSISETWGLVVNEAMASGLPIIVSKQCGCASTLIQDSANGFVFDANNQSELESILVKVFSLSQNELQDMKKRSLNIIDNWDLDRFSQGAIDAMDYALNNKRKKLYFVSKYLLKKWTGRYNQI